MAKHLLEVGLADGGAQRGDGVADAVLRQRHDVHVAFHQNQLAKLALAASRLEQAVQLAAFLEDVRFRRVEVLRPRVLAVEDPPAKADGAPAGIANGKDDALAKAVVDAPAVVLGKQAGGKQLVLAEAGQGGLQPLPAAGRKADAEVRDHLLGQAAIAQVAMRLLRQAVVVQPALELPAGRLEHFVDARVRSRCPAAFAGHFEAHRRGERLHGFGEGQAVDIHYETQRGAVGAAAETVVVAVGIDVKGGRLLFVERAAAHVVGASLAQFHPRADDVDDVHALEEVVDEGLRNLPGHAASIVRCGACVGAIRFDKRPEGSGLRPR